MTYGLLVIVHIIVALFLIIIILIQGGRGGMGEALGGAAAQSLFGGGANVVMGKITTAAAAVFMVTSLSLAVLSTAKGRSVIDQVPVTPDQLPMALPQPLSQAPAAPDAHAPVSKLEEPVAHPKTSPPSPASEPAP